MQLRDGMLGVVIVAIAIAVALFGAYLAGVEPEEHQVTKYKYLTDAVSGMFEYDQTPQYIEFDPSTNYTGYYSEDSYSEFRNKYFFDSDQVGFVENTSVNNYRVDIEPERLYYEVNHILNPVSGGDPWNDSDGHRIELFIAKSWMTESRQGEVADFLNTECNVRTIEKQMEPIVTQNPTANTIYIVSKANLNVDDLDLYTINNLDFVLFSTKSNWAHYGDIHRLYVAQDVALGKMGYEYDVDLEPLFKTKVSRPYVACKYDVTTKDVMLYTDISMEEKYAYGPFKASNTFMCFGGNQGGSPWDVPGVGYFNLTDTVEMEVEQKNVNVYLNPNYGVALKEPERGFSAKTLYDDGPQTYTFKYGTEITIYDVTNGSDYGWFAPNAYNKFTLTETVSFDIEHYISNMLEGTVTVTFKVRGDN